MGQQPWAKQQFDNTIDMEGKFNKGFQEYLKQQR